MKISGTKKRWRTVLIWMGWVVLAQLILINISAALYAYKFTHLRASTSETWAKPESRNIFAKTWRLFTGPVCYKQALNSVPPFPFSTVALKTHDEIPIEAWYARTDSPAKGTVILFHGLMGHKGFVINEAATFRSLGYNIMMVDIRNHGHSGGSVTTFGYKESEEVKLAYDYLVEAGAKNIFIWGASLGAVETARAVSAYNLQVSGIILEMPFLSLESHLKGRARILGFPSQPFGFLTSFWIGAENGFNGLGLTTTSAARNIHCPVLMQYGKKDELVLPYETEAIFQAIASNDKRMVVYEDCGHESLLQNDPVTWEQEVSSFLGRSSKAIF